MENIKIALISNIKAKRKELGINQEKLAELAGLSTTYIKNIERGVSWPSPESIELIADSLNSSSSELMVSSTPKQRPFAETLPVGRLIQLLDSKASSVPDEIFDLSKGIAKDNKVWESVIVLLERAHKELEKQKGKSESI